MTHEPTGTELAPGRLVAGRFRLERLLGKGGMGSVWAARHLGLGVDVAIKFVDTDPGQFDDAARRFAREAMAAAKVRSPYVVNVFDSGADAFGRPYLAMELLEGEELGRRLERYGRLPVAEVCRVVVHACRGLGRAHAAGVVHRDLKPENLFLVWEEDGFVAKLLDFGIAKADALPGPSMTLTGHGLVMGTPLYMSPEQARGGGEVDFRSDLYSLGVVAFCCLTGRVPFPAESLGEFFVKVSAEAVPSARALRPELPAAVDAWFRRAMHKKPAKRFQSAREMADAFVRACGASASLARPTPPPARAAAAPAGAAFAASSPGPGTLFGASTNPARPPARPWGGLGFASLFGVFLLGVLPFFLTSLKRSADDARRRPAPSAAHSAAAGGASDVAAVAPAAPAASPVAPRAEASDAPGGRPPAKAETPKGARTVGRVGPAAVSPGRPPPASPVVRHAAAVAPPKAPHKARGPVARGTDWGLD